MIYALIPAIPALLILLLVALRRRQIRIQKFLNSPAIEGVVLPSPDDERWVWKYSLHGFYEGISAELGVFSVYGSTIFVDGVSLAQNSAYVDACIKTAARIHDQKRLETMQQKALACLGAE